MRRSTHFICVPCNREAYGEADGLNICDRCRGPADVAIDAELMRDWVWAITDLDLDKATH